MVISTEPFSLHPDPSHRTFSHLWRTTNDINANIHTILDRADTNDKWAPLAGPGSWNDPDMLEVGNGGLTDGQSRIHFGLWCLMKSPLILGTNLAKLSPSQLAIVSNKALIAVNQDALGIQARKLAVNGVTTPRFASVARCDEGGQEAGYNGVSRASLVWTPLPSAYNASYVRLFNNETGRCLTMGPYFSYPTAPLLAPCDAGSAAQAWLLPTGAKRLGALLWAPALEAGGAAALAVGASTLYSAIHGRDATPVPDSNYGLFNVTLQPYAPEPFCNNRGCDNYAPEQNWYWSPVSGKLHLGHFAANNYRCFGPNCYALTNHLPTGAQLCLAHVLSFDGNVGTDPSGSSLAGVDVWGGPLSGVDTPYGDYVLALVNRDAAAAHNVSAPFSLLEVPGMDANTTMCARELFSGATLGVVKGAVTLSVPAMDAAVVRLTTGTTC